MKVYSSDSFATIYKESLLDLFNSPEFITKPRDLNIKENINVALEIKNPLLSIYSNKRRGSQTKYIAAELLWYFLGRDDVDFIREYAKFWVHIQNDDGTVNSSYGRLLFNKKNKHGLTQYEWALKSLINDIDTRQAILHFNSSEHQYFKNKDFVCTMYGVFHIRNNRLDLTIHMRSNDAILGTPTDVAFFTCLQQQFLLHLKYLKYPTLKLGKYTHIVNSYHLYEKHFNLVKEMLSEDFDEEQFPILDKNLINPSGEPTTSLRLFENNHKEILPSSMDFTDDKLYIWIKYNINKI